MVTKAQLTILGAAFLLNYSSYAGARVIYGEDNRIEVAQGTPFQQQLASAAASLISEKNLLTKNSKFYKVDQKATLNTYLKTLSYQKYPACREERFINQPNAAHCSGFLIAPDLLVTAGHCVETQDQCESNHWVFDFKTDARGKNAGKKIPVSNVYKCKKLISQSLNHPLNMDYALVQLDRRVEGRTPLDINNGQVLRNYTQLTVIGSPSGLPLKVSDGAWVRENVNPHYFSANIDSFQGNSGSAVLDSKTGRVEGILVRGEQDFEVDYNKNCVKSYRCLDNNCRGEDVTRLTVIPEIGIQLALNQAAFQDDVATLNILLKLGTWVDFYSKDGQTALMKASLGGSARAIEALIAAGAEVNLQDTEGNSGLHHLAKGLNHKSRGALEILLKHGAKLDLKNLKGETPLDVALNNGNSQGVAILTAKNQKTLAENKSF